MLRLLPHAQTLLEVRQNVYRQPSFDAGLQRTTQWIDAGRGHQALQHALKHPQQLDFGAELRETRLLRQLQCVPQRLRVTGLNRVPKGVARRLQLFQQSCGLVHIAAVRELDVPDLVERLREQLDPSRLNRPDESGLCLVRALLPCDGHRLVRLAPLGPSASVDGLQLKCVGLAQVRQGHGHEGNRQLSKAFGRHCEVRPGQVEGRCAVVGGRPPLLVPSAMFPCTLLGRALPHDHRVRLHADAARMRQGDEHRAVAHAHTGDLRGLRHRPEYQDARRKAATHGIRGAQALQGVARVWPEVLELRLDRPIGVLLPRTLCPMALAHRRNVVVVVAVCAFLPPGPRCFAAGVVFVAVDHKRGVVAHDGLLLALELVARVLVADPSGPGPFQVDMGRA
mmetsp:Transcript_117966/g.341015  ORF Transcript_117966/g.341015 Transcript_117966/m.341015 type:complete len:395 (-) Transcript_117966:872-2056(-)